MDGRREPVRGSLLYVEDEEITRETVLSLIARRFPELVVHSAPDGARGLELFQEFRPELVITDIRMPVMNGIEMARGILELDRTVPIIVTTAHSDLDYLIRSIELGVSRYLLKPVDSGQLFDAVEGCLASLRAARQIEELNRAVAQRNDELEAANRDLESFSYTVSHDLRTPLTNINGYCQLILELFGSRLDEQCKGFIEIILEQTLQMSELIRTLLEFSRLNKAELVRLPTDLSAIAEPIGASLKLSEPGRRVEFAVEPGVTAHCDPDLVRVVLANLLGNAYKYSAQQEEALIEFGRAGGEPGVYFVRDNGAGFEMSEAERLFAPFQRLHPDGEFQGFGIGLATVQRIIQRHGGRIWPEGAVGQGATFYFTLPE